MITEDNLIFQQAEGIIYCRQHREFHYISPNTEESHTTWACRTGHAAQLIVDQAAPIEWQPTLLARLFRNVGDRFTGRTEETP